MDQNKTEESRDLDLCRNWLEALRQELLEQGELLALLEKQRSALELDGGLSLVHAIKEADHQFHVVLAAQAKSIEAERTVLEQCQIKESLPMQELLARLPA
ncbi:MAG TPA: hypothetical protein VNZ22_16300, partial [Bacillota bacterium]|nr:hypothetical protein [Bacillota bacterium]